MTTPLDLALEYASKGIPVFPCRAAAETTDQVDPDTGEFITLEEKTPLTSNGFKGATTNERIIRTLWERHPDAMIGIPTGEKSGLWVLDVDNKHGKNGDTSLAELEAQNGALPDTARGKTAGGGSHYLFKHVSGVRNRGEMGDGLDVRGEGGYIIAPGSKLASGAEYDWYEDSPGLSQIADAPEWLLHIVLPRADTPAAAPATKPTTTSLPPQENPTYVQAAIDAELADLASAPPGTRNNRLNDASFCLGQFVGAGVVSESNARAYLEAIARQWPNFQKSKGTISRGLKDGAQHPRSIPAPTGVPEDNTRLVDISRMIESGLRKKDAPVTKTDEPEAKPPLILATPFEWKDPTKLPRREFLFGKHYIRKYVSVTVAPGGLGKTSNSIVEALAMATGRELCGVKPEKRAKVWIFNAEDPRDELDRRIAAANIHYRIRPSDLERQLFVDTGREQELVVAIEDKKSGVRIIEPIVEAVVEQITRHGIDVMIVDPFVSTHGVNENDNGAIDKVAKLWAHIADRTNCSIDIVHHLRKVADREATVDDARGAVSLIGAARSVRVLNRMSPDQAASAGVDDKNGYFSITYGKANLTPLSSKLDWRKMESVGLGNGEGLAKPQDHAPVVTDWAWPTAEDIAAEHAKKLPAVKVLLDNGAYKRGAQAKDWAGDAIAYSLGLDSDDKATRKKCGMILKAWLDSGELAVVAEKDELSRKNAEYVRSAGYAERHRDE